MHYVSVYIQSLYRRRKKNRINFIHKKILIFIGVWDVERLWWVTRSDVFFYWPLMTNKPFWKRIQSTDDMSIIMDEGLCDFQYEIETLSDGHALNKHVDSRICCWLDFSLSITFMHQNVFKEKLEHPQMSMKSTDNDKWQRSNIFYTHDDCDKESSARPPQYGP